MRAFGDMMAAFALAGALAGGADAADIRVLSVGAVEEAVRNLGADFAKESGHHVVLTVAGPVAVLQKIKNGEVFDAVIIAEAAMDRLDKDGLVNPESRERLATGGMAVAVRTGARVPDLSTPEAFKQALLAAKSIVYDDPALPNQSGQMAEQVLVKAGILDTLRPKIRIVPGQAASQELVANGEVEMGLYNRSEIPEAKGLSIAGAVPAPLQIDITYEGALLSDGAAPEATRAFLRFMSGPDGRPRWVAAKLEPLADH
jgi:molybdate transport system substrate-binding protein